MQPSFYAVIPANVRYCKTLTPNAKLLYAEITSLCNLKNMCWATNSYFAQLYDVSEDAVKKWISSLVREGFILSEVKKNIKGTKRIISLPNPVDKNLDTGVGKNIPTGEEKFIPTYIESNLNNNNLENRDINISTKEIKTARKPKRQNYEMPAYVLTELKTEIWEEWQEYRKEKNKTLTNTVIKRQIEFLYERWTQGDNPNEVIIQSIRNGWTGLFPLQAQNHPTLKKKNMMTIDKVLDEMFDTFETVEAKII